MASEQRDSILLFAPLHSNVDVGFWHSFSSLKLNKLGTDDSPIPITGFYAPCSSSKVSNNLTLLAESLPPETSDQSLIPSISRGNRNRCPVPGILYNTNTAESFLSVNKRSLMKAEAKKIWDDILSGKAEEDCAVLSRFLIVSFADLKSWKFRYWVAFPALVLDPPATLVNLRPASQWFSSEEAESVSAACNGWRTSSSTADVPFFLVSIDSTSRATVRHLKYWEACQGDGHKLLFGFYDPCHLPSPGWPLRNFLALICSRWNIKKVHFLCYRENRGFADMGSSIVGEALISVPQGWKDNGRVPNAVGLEVYKDVPFRTVDLAYSMDPKRLAITAAHLNLTLMTWRALPSLNLARLSSLKCLLLGAGTLGCQVARMLMAWGIRKITLVDNGKVSMSNPLRQSLYTYEDCCNGGVFKTEAAVNSLNRIFPAMEAKGVRMSIPMPGHPVSSQEERKVLDECRCLHDLIDSHDVVFLLTDTRESRWLPSLLCANANKITITAALGFDSFLAMRHGAGPLSPSHINAEADGTALSADLGNFSLSDKRQRLGCYFCNDVVAPIDSTANRTLDQQCTVTRPGLAPIASSLAVELLVGILHHPHGIYAEGEVANSSEQPLGILPHQIRGSLSQFSQMILVGQSSSSCTACSSLVVSEYRKRGMEFVLQAINHPTYLEDLTGLTELMKSVSSLKFDWDNETDGDGDGDECVEI